MEKVKIKYAAIIAFMLLCIMIAAAPRFTGADESSDTGKQLVVKVVGDEELVDIDDYDIPLFSFSARPIRKLLLSPALTAPASAD